MIPLVDPRRGVDYDELIEVHTFKEVDDMQVRLWKENAIPGEKWVIEPFDSACHIEFRKCFIGWRLKRKDGKRIWMRLSMYDLVADHLRDKDAQRS